MHYLFSTPIKKTKVRVGLYAYKYPNGIIAIGDKQYLGYSMTTAIKLFRNQTK
jgi:hypothetical protein